MKRAAAACLFFLALAPVAAYPNDTYVDGMLIAQFKPEHMPSSAQVSLVGSPPFLGRPDVDQVLRRHRCYRIGKFLPTFDRETPRGFLTASSYR